MHAQSICIQTKHGSVIDYLAEIIAPAAIACPADGNVLNIFAHDARHKRNRIRAANFVFKQGADVNYAGSMTQAVVFAVVGQAIGGHGAVAGPIGPFVAGAQSCCSIVKWRWNWHLYEGSEFKG